MRYITCSHCHAVLKRRDVRCPLCRTLLSPEKIERITLCRHDGTPVPMNKSFCPACGKRARSISIHWWGWLLLVLIASIAVTILHSFVATTYRSVSCVIETTSIFSTSSKYGTTYAPDFTYEMKDSQGQVLASGESTLGFPSDYSSSDQAQQAVNRYHPGSAYPCWYSPIASPSVMLKVPDGTISAGPAIVGLVVTDIWLALIIGGVVTLGLHPIQLARRGVASSGVVKDHEYHKDKHGRYQALAILVFQTQTEPALKCQIKVPDRRWGRKVDIFYDRLNPTGNVLVRNHFTGKDAFFEVLVGSLLLSLLVGGGGWFLLQFICTF